MPFFSNHLYRRNNCLKTDFLDDVNTVFDANSRFTFPFNSSLSGRTQYYIFTVALGDIQQHDYFVCDMLSLVSMERY